MLNIKTHEQRHAKTCPYCKDRLEVGQKLFQCRDCKALIHVECWYEHSTCMVCNGRAILAVKLRPDGSLSTPKSVAHTDRSRGLSKPRRSTATRNVVGSTADPAEIWSRPSIQQDTRVKEFAMSTIQLLGLAAVPGFISFICYSLRDSPHDESIAGFGFMSISIIFLILGLISGLFWLINYLGSLTNSDQESDQIEKW